MASFTREVVINRRRQQVWDYCIDFSNAKRWIRGVERIEVITEGAIGLGTKFRETRTLGGRTETHLIEITAFDPPTHYTASANASGATVSYSYRLADHGEDATLVQLVVNITLSGLAGKIFAPLAMTMIKKFDGDQLELLKRAIEPV